MHGYMVTGEGRRLCRRAGRRRRTRGDSPTNLCARCAGERHNPVENVSCAAELRARGCLVVLVLQCNMEVRDISTVHLICRH